MPPTITSHSQPLPVRRARRSGRDRSLVHLSGRRTFNLPPMKIHPLQLARKALIRAACDTSAARKGKLRMLTFEGIVRQFIYN